MEAGPFTLAAEVHLSTTDADHYGPHGADVAGRARREAARRCGELGRPDLADDAALVVSELVTNALLHGGGCTGVTVGACPGGVRVEVRDPTRLSPLLAHPSEGSLTGRGMRLVQNVAEDWGADAEAVGKVVWAVVTGKAKPGAGTGPGAGPGPEEGGHAHDQAEILAMRGDEDDDVGPGPRRFRVELGDVPTELLLAAKSHVDNLVREFTLASAGALSGQTAQVPDHLRRLLRAVVDRFAEARLAIKRQAVRAAEQGTPTTRLVLDLPASAAEAAEDYVRALDEIDGYCRARRLLTLETPEQHRVFRHWYVEELVRSLRAAAIGHTVPPTRTFEERLLAELGRAADARRLAERSARLYTVAAALAGSSTPERVAEAVLSSGMAALGARAGAVILVAEGHRLVVLRAVGYDEEILARLHLQALDAHLPAASALRTGEGVWLESPADRDRRFPDLAGLEQGTISLCVVPLEVQGRRLGVLRFSFADARLFDDDERQFVTALAAQTAQALERTRLQWARIDASRRLQRRLLPPRVPEIAGAEVAVLYRPFGDEMEVGGDFYDIWALSPRQWAVAIGDAAGTGPEAAAMTALVRHTVRALTLAGAGPAQVLATLNSALLDAAAPDDDERFCTVLLGLVTVGQGVEVELATGGHPPPLVRRAGGQVTTIGVRGSLLGVFPGTDIGTARVVLGPGDTLVAVTDGVLEARRDGEMFGVEGLARLLATPPPAAQAVIKALEDAVLDHTGGSLTDDMAAVVLHIPG